MQDIFWLGISHIKDWQSMSTDGSCIDFELYCYLPWDKNQRKYNL